MLRARFVPLLIPVVAGAAFLWYRRRKKSHHRDNDDDGGHRNFDDDDSANGSEAISAPASPLRLPSLSDDLSPEDDNQDSGAISSDESPPLTARAILPDDASPTPSSAVEPISETQSSSLTIAIPTTAVDGKNASADDSVFSSDEGPGDKSQTPKLEQQQQSQRQRHSSNSSVTSSTSSSVGKPLANNGDKLSNGWSGGSNGGSNNGGNYNNNSFANNGYNNHRNGVNRRRTRGSISDSITSTGSECDNWRENMGKSWEPLPEPRPSSDTSTSALQQQQQQQQLSQQQRGVAGRNSSTSSNAAATADDKDNLGKSSTNASSIDDAATSTTKNGIIVTYPAVSSKNKWNNYHNNNVHNHNHQRYHGGLPGSSSNGAPSRKGGTPTPPPPPPPPVHPDQHVVYEFAFPSEFIGRLIGKGGRNLQQMMKETNAQIAVRKEAHSTEEQIVTVHGRQADVQSLLASIRAKFPKHRHPNIDLSPLNVPLSRELTNPNCLPLSLPEGAPVDAVVASVVSAGQIFLQLPTHPTFPNLPRLDACMLSCYSVAAAPPMPTPIDSGAICAAPLAGGWFRAQFVQMVEHAASPSAPSSSSPLGLDEHAWIRWVDYGGYCQVALKDMRQIRSDFVNLPFQAIECYMANLAPPSASTSSEAPTNDSSSSAFEFPVEAALFLEEAVKNVIIQAQVVAYAADGTPYVHLYRDGSGGEETRTLINKELVDNGFATWVEALTTDPGMPEGYGADAFR